jgi:murein DD-endopeptidase MepM/ murein hydrolase activator NlpD
VRAGIGRTLATRARVVFGGRAGVGGWREPARATLVRAGFAAVIFASGFAAGVAGRGDAENGAAGVAGQLVNDPRPVDLAAGGGETLQGFPSRYRTLRDGETQAADSAARAMAWVPSGSPLPGGRLTSSYTPRRYHPLLRRVRPHWGIDIAAPAGTPVLASGDGIVAGIARSPSYGLVVDVSHGGGRYVTRYAHLSAILVRVGEAVVQGAPIGRVGSTGLSTGPHLHYEVYAAGRSRDPGLILAPGAGSALLP